MAARENTLVALILVLFLDLVALEKLAGIGEPHLIGNQKVRKGMRVRFSLFPLTRRLVGVTSLITKRARFNSWGRQYTATWCSGSTLKTLQPPLSSSFLSHARPRGRYFGVPSLSRISSFCR